MDGKDIKWDRVPQYTSCQTLDILDYFDLSSNTPLQIFINVAKVENFGVSFYFEDRNTGLKRKQKSNMLAYNGPKLHNYILNEPMKYKIIFKFFQNIHLQDDPAQNCKNYPNSDDKSYKECDQKYLYDQFKNYYKIMPFWVTDDFDQVTKSMYEFFFDNFNQSRKCLLPYCRVYNGPSYFDHVDGTNDSPCNDPCETFRVKKINNFHKYFFKKFLSLRGLRSLVKILKTTTQHWM